MKAMDRGQPTSTVEGGQDTVGAPADVTHREQRRARAWRRLILLLLIAFLVLGALNFFGVRMAEGQAQKDPYQLQVSYPKTGRPGIGAPLQIQVQRQGGFEGPVTITMSRDYLDILDVRSIDPEPSQSTSTDKELVWQFDPPQGDTVTVSLNAEFEPSEHPGRHHGAISVLEQDKPAVQVQFTTWEAP
jgi:hypothetical protein